MSLPEPELGPSGPSSISLDRHGDYVTNSMTFDGRNSLQAQTIHAENVNEEIEAKAYTSENIGERETLGCIDTCSYKLHKSQFINSSQEVKKYWQKLMLLYSSVNEELRFPIFPGKTEETNHLSAQIWMVTYAIQDISDDLAELVDINKLNELYGRTIIEGSLTETALKELYSPLEYLSKNGSNCISEMKISVAMLIEFSTATNSKEPDILTTATSLRSIRDHDLEVKKSILTGSRIQVDNSFNRLKVYMRTAARRKWYAFSGLERAQRLSIIKDSLGIVSDSFAKLRKLLLPILLALRDGKSSIFRKTLLKHLRKMTKHLNKMNSNKDIFNRDEHEILTELRRVEAYFNSVIGNGHKIIRQILESIGMTRLCYRFVVDHLTLEFTPWEEIRKCFADEHNFSPESDYDPDDLLKTKYPDVLRKVPVIVNRVELSLHKQMDSKRRNSIRRSWVGDGS